MTEPPSEDLRTAFADALGEMAAAGTAVRLTETPAPADAFAAFRARFPDRSDVAVGPAEVAPGLERAAAEQRSVHVAGPAESVVPALRAWLDAHGPEDAGPVRFVATRSGLVGSVPPGRPAVLDDLSVALTIPGLTVLVPSDGPTVRAMAAWLPRSAAPAYVRLGELPVTSLDGPPWEAGCARPLRDGADIGLLAVGTMVPRALAAADALAKVGVAARVLDVASIKPFDLKAVLRAARDTGALLTLEEHLVAQGVGTLVAAITAENYPVPVRRFGIPDLAARPASGTAGLDALGLNVERIVDEAWELLRLKGKVQ